MNWSLLLRNLKSPATRRARRFRWLAIVLLVYTVTGFFVVPAILKSQLVKRLPGLTHRQAAVQQVKVNPYALSLTIRGLSLTETNGEVFAGFDEFYINFRLSSLFRWVWTFGEIKLARPTANIVRGVDGQFNFADLLAGQPAPPPKPERKPGSLPIILIQHLVVTNGDFNFADQTRATPLRINYSPVDLDLKNFTTRRNKNGLYSLAVTTRDGGNFAWSGTVSANPPQSAGKFLLQGVVLKTYSPYVADFARAEITDGVLEVGAEYRLNAEPSPLELDVTNASVKVANLQVKAPGGTNEMLLAVDNVAVTRGSASLATREARLPLVTVRGGSVLARRESDGQLNWLKLLVEHTNSATTSASSEPSGSSGTAAPWKATLDEFNLEGFSVTAEDQALATPAQLGLDDLRLDVKGISNQSNAPIAATIEFNWRGGGTVRVEANGSLLPPTGEAKLAVTNLALPPLQPYIEQQARLVLNAGDLTLKGHVSYAQPDRNAPVVQFTGDVSVAKFASIDTVAYHDIAKWEDLSVRGIQLSLQTNALSVEEVKFSGLETSLVINSNGQLNVQTLLKAKTSAVAGAAPHVTDSPDPTPPAPGSFPMKVAVVVFEKCSFFAADQSLTRHFNTSIEEFNGTIRNLTLPGLNKAGVDIRGKVSALAPFEVTGSIMPDATNPFVDLKLTLKNDDLTPFTPYTEKFAGHALNKGKLSFDLSYKIANRKLDAVNVIAIDQFTFGPRNDSTNATKLPVKLAVALLKDRNGRINLDLPVSGSLDDPKFSIAGLMWKAVVNILVKAATSPFSLLGAMFGGGEELQYVDFQPGIAMLDTAQTNKLNTLAKALYQRPALNLEISASVDAAADRELLARQKLQDKIKSLRMQELAARGKPVPSLSELKLEPGDYERLLRQTYKDAFKIDPERALREARAAAAATNAPAAPATTRPGVGQSTEIAKGATQLVQASSGMASGKATPPNPPAGSNAAPAKPKSEHDLVLDELEQRLMTAAPATDDDLRELMQQRSLSVQKFLLDSGKVTAERLFPVAPKPVDPAVKGMARATFSLD